MENPSTLNRYSFWFPLLGVENSHSRVLHCKLNLISFHDSTSEWKLSRGLRMWCEWIIWVEISLSKANCWITEFIADFFSARFRFQFTTLHHEHVYDQSFDFPHPISIFIGNVFAKHLLARRASWKNPFIDTFEFIALAIWIQIIIKGCCRSQLQCLPFTGTIKNSFRPEEMETFCYI